MSVLRLIHSLKFFLKIFSFFKPTNSSSLFIYCLWDIHRWSQQLQFVLKCVIKIINFDLIISMTYKIGDKRWVIGKLEIWGKGHWDPQQNIWVEKEEEMKDYMDWLVFYFLDVDTPQIQELSTGWGKKRYIVWWFLPSSSFFSCLHLNSPTYFYFRAHHHPLFGFPSLGFVFIFWERVIW